MLRIGKYSLVPSRHYFQACLHHSILVRRKSGPCEGVQEKGNAECQFSVFVSVSLALLTNFYSNCLGRYHCRIFQPSTQKPQPQNGLSICARKPSILWSSVAAGGARNELSPERFLMFPRTEITVILFTILSIALLPFICPVVKYPIPTPISHLPTASCTYSQRRLCRRDGLSRT